MAVVPVDVGVERTGVDDQSDGCTSAARISSTRSEISLQPLAPAPAARRRRLPGLAPRKASIASRVSSDTVLPLRSASCRRRASSSSGSFTVVRCMYASIPSNHRCRQGDHQLADDLPVANPTPMTSVASRLGVGVGISRRSCEGSSRLACLWPVRQPVCRGSGSRALSVPPRLQPELHRQHR